MSDKHVPLKRPYRDRLNVEHDMAIGPCACGAWHDSHNPPPAMMAFKPASPWIPVTAETPLPASGEALVEYSNGLRVYWSDVSVMGEGRHDVVAYQLVEPFVPPKPKRDHRLIKDGDREREYIEKLDGDVAPDAARKAREYADRDTGASTPSKATETPAATSSTS